MHTQSSLRFITRLFALWLLGLLSLSPARADYNVDVQLSPSAATAQPGETLSYTVTFTNHELFNIDLDNVSLNLTSPPAGFDSSWILPILNTSPVTVNAGIVGTPTVTQGTDLITLLVAPELGSDPSFLTNYTGTLAFTDSIGGVVSTPFALNVSQAGVSTVPEPGFYALSSVMGMSALGLWKRSRKQC